MSRRRGTQGERERKREMGGGRRSTGRGRERGEGRGAKTRSRPLGARCPGGGAGRPGAGSARALPAAPGRGEDPGPPGWGVAGRVVGLSRRARASEAGADTWELFPSPGILRTRGSGAAGAGGGGVGIFRSGSARFGQGLAGPRPLREKDERRGPAGAAGRAGEAGGRGGGVQPYLGGFPPECTSSCFH